MKPVIGISCAWSVETWGDSIERGGYYYVGKPYVEAVHKHGGIPILIPPEFDADEDELIDNIISSMQGFIFSGGGDAKTSHDEYMPTLKEQQPKRYHLEKKLMKKIWDKKIPVIAICRGHQMTAEVFGGSISEDILKNHKQNLPGDKTWHEVIVDKDSKIYQLIQEERIQVNSFHKQFVNEIPNGFRAVIKTREGIVEAIEATEHPFYFGFQYHPEELRPIDKVSQNIFKSFIRAACKLQK